MTTTWPRREDPILLSTTARFMADISAEGALHCAFVRSSVAHARISLGLPGVVPPRAILTAADLGAGKVPSIHSHAAIPARLEERSSLRQAEVHQPILASDRVLFVGQPIALVVAESRYLAEDLAEEVTVEYEDLPVLTSPADSLREGAPELSECRSGNRSVQLRLVSGRPPEESSDMGAITGRIAFGRETGAPIETRGILAYLDEGSGRLVVWSNTQIPHALREAIAIAFSIPQGEVRVLVPEVGGSFGTKGVVSAEELAVVGAALALRRPLRWLEDRYESLCSAVQGRDQAHQITLRAGRDGKLRSLEDRIEVDVGAFDPFGKSVPYNTAAHVPGPYRIPHIDISATSVLTNKPPAAPYRGSGRPEAHLARECAIDRLARRLGIDPLTLRERNLLGSGDMPYDTGLLYRDGTPLVYDGFDTRACLRAAMAEAGTKPASGSGSRRVGRGVACYVASSGMGPYETARVEVRDDGKILLATGATCQGQSHATTFARLVGDALGISATDCILVPPDTDALEDGWGTMASRSAVAAGNAAAIAAGSLRRQLEDLDATAAMNGGHPGRSRRANGSVAETLSPEKLRDLVRVARAAGREDALSATGVFRPPTITWGCGVHVAVIEVDVELRQIHLVDYVAAYDHGPILDQFVVDGQMYGAIAQGLGGVLCEELTFDASGQPTSTNLADYLLPTAGMFPHIRLVKAAESPSALNPLGLRGLGEAGTVAPPAAVVNALEDALQDLHLEVDHIPLTCERLHRLLETVGL